MEARAAGALQIDPPTRLIELERSLEQRTLELDDARAQLGALSYSVSHDLRAPLRAIDGFSEALLEDYGAQLDAPARQLLGRVRAGAQRMSQLMDGLLELSRVASAPLHRTHVDLSELAASILDELHRRDPERMLSASVAPGVVVNADPQLMRLVLECLLGNAWKFTAPKPDARIQLGQEAGGTLFVADNGVGFDMAYASRLFSPFQRLHRSVDFEGIGLGLALVRHVLARHRGRVWVEAEPGLGAKFLFEVGGNGV